MCDQRRGSSDKKKRPGKPGKNRKGNRLSPLPSPLSFSLIFQFVVLSRISRRSICIVDPSRASSLSAEKRPGSKAENFHSPSKVTFPKACLYQKLNPKTPIPKRTNTMSAQDESTAQPTSPTLCKMGCGFFGSNATGDCCSKCYKDLLAREGGNANNNNTANNSASSTTTAAPAPAASVVASPAPAPAAPAEPAPMEVDETPAPAAPEAAAPKPEEAPAAAAASGEEAPKKKKKKKKASYKNMMATMMTGGSPDAAAKSQEDKIRQVTGGGQFSKIDKI